MSEQDKVHFQRTLGVVVRPGDASHGSFPPSGINLAVSQRRGVEHIASQKIKSGRRSSKDVLRSSAIGDTGRIILKMKDLTG